MKKVDYSQVDDATSRLMKAKADILFPMLLSDKQMEDIQTKRVKSTPRGTKIKEVKESEYIIKDGGYDLDGSPVDDFDIRRYMDEAEDQETGTMHDLKIDIRDLKMAKNFYDYCFNFLGPKINPPFARQMWIGLMLFGEVCPCCSKKDWLNVHNVPVDYDSKKLTRHLVLLEKGKCPDCGRSKRLLKRKYGLHDYIQLANVLGQRSGKSLTLAMYSSYVTHKHLKFPPIATLTKLMQASTELTGTFVSLTFGKARGLMWAPYKKIIEDSVFFQDYFEIMDHYKEKYGKELYKVSTEYMRFHHRNLFIYPSGPRSTVLRGDCLTGDTMINTTRGFVRFDELGFPNGLVPSTGSVDTPFGPRKLTHTYKKQDREIVRILTRNGFELKGTPEHPVLVLMPDLSYQWVRLDEVESGQFIVSKTSNSAPLFGTNSSVTLDMATIMGTFLANGYRNGISSDDPQVIESFSAAVGRCGFTVKSKWTNDTVVRASIHGVHTGTRGKHSEAYGFAEVLADWGYATVRSAEKQIPLSVRTAPREILHEFLEAYFACDCGINGGTTAKARSAGRTTGVEVEISSASQNLARQLQVILLQAYGIVGRLRKSIELKNMSTVRYTEKQYVTWILSLTGYDAHRFAQTFTRAKIQKYATRIKYVKPGLASDRRQLPYIRQLLDSLYTDHSVGRKITLASGQLVPRPKAPALLACTTAAARRNATPCAEFVIYEDPWFEKNHSLVEKVDPELAINLKSFLEMQAHYEEVVSVKRVSKKTVVYDITVPDGHAFMANGLSSHNTRIFAGLDELGLFPLPKGDTEEDETSERANADEAHKSLFTSLGTMNMVYESLMKEGYYTCPKPVLFNVSSPYSMRDKMMRLLKESRETDVGTETILGINLPTWEVNPGFTRQSPMIVAAYNSNYEKAERDWGANPPAVHSRFIQPSTLKDGIFVNGNNSHNFIYQYDIAGEVYGKIERIRTFRYPSVIAIDAGHCVAGDTLIPTDRGLLRIDQIGAHAGKKVTRDCGLRVGSRYKPEVAAQWHYMGVYPVRHMTTASGHELRATYVHPQLVLRDGDHVWVKMGDLQVGDLVCINPTQIVRKTKLHLDLKVPEVTLPSNNTSGTKGVYYNKRSDRHTVILYESGVRRYMGTYKTRELAEGARHSHMSRMGSGEKATSTKAVQKPSTMSPDLAYLLGAIVSEGYCNNYQVSVANSDADYLDKLESVFHSVFGVSCTRGVYSRAGQPVKCANTGRSYQAAVDVEQLIACSRTLASFVQQLGVKDSREHGRKSAYHKEIPWSVLQADSASQLAFLASYIEGDGHIRKDRHSVSIWSASKPLIDQMQVLLNAHGVMSNKTRHRDAWLVTTASSIDASRLVSLTEPYMSHAKKYDFIHADIISEKYGFPCRWVRDFVYSRKIKSSNQGTLFECDGRKQHTLRALIPLLKRIGASFLYQHFESGDYDEFLYDLKKLSPTTHAKLLKMFELKYRYSPIAELKDCGKEPVYDLTMKDGVEPAFIANGMVIHNTNNSFIVVGGHYDFDTGKTVVTTLLECLPTEGRKINFNLLYQGVILALAKDLNAVGLGADQWQSIDLLYRIRQDMGLNPEGKPRTLPKQYSPKRADFEATRAMLENKNLILPTLQQQEIDYILDGRVENYRTEMMNKPVNHFLLQAVTIRDAGPTRAPEKGEHTTDDIWRAIVLLTKCIHNEKVMERLVEARNFNYDGVRVGMPMPGFASRSGMVNRYGQRSR